MSNSSKIKGRKCSKRSNQMANLDRPLRMKPYGQLVGNTYSNDDKHIVSEVNKKSARQSARKQIQQELDGNE